MSISDSPYWTQTLRPFDLNPYYTLNKIKKQLFPLFLLFIPNLKNKFAFQWFQNALKVPACKSAMNCATTNRVFVNEKRLFRNGIISAGEN